MLGEGEYRRKKRGGGGEDESSPDLERIAQADSCKCVSIVAQGEAFIFIWTQQELANW